MKHRRPIDLIQETDPRYEHGFIKYPGEEMVDITTDKKSRIQVNQDYDKERAVIDSHPGKHYTSVHTHTKLPWWYFLYKITNTGAAPSYVDWNDLLFDKKQKSSVIVQRDKKTGEEQGRYVLKKSREFGRNYPYAPVDDLLDELKYSWQIAFNPLYLTKKVARINRIKFRAVPAKGYKMNWRGIFVKDKSAGIEQKVAAIVISTGFVVSLFFLSSSITGFTILSLNKIISNTIGACLFIACIIGLYLLNKSNIKKLRNKIKSK